MDFRQICSKSARSVLFHRLPCSVDRPEYLLTLVRADVGGLKDFVVGGVGFVVLGAGFGSCNVETWVHVDDSHANACHCPAFNSPIPQLLIHLIRKSV